MSYTVILLVECKALLASGSVHAKLEARIILRYVHRSSLTYIYIKCKKHFIKMLKDVGMVVPKIKGTRL